METNNRRGFLRGLASLPLIGGGVVLVGQPTRVAAAATDEQLARYAAFCWCEMNSAVDELERKGVFVPGQHNIADVLRRDLMDLSYGTSPTLRAPLVMSAAGVPLT